MEISVVLTNHWVTIKIKYQEKRLKIAQEIGDRSGEGAGYGNLGCCYRSLGDYQKAIEYHEKGLKIAQEIGDRCGEGAGYGNLGCCLPNHWVTIKKSKY